jgi:3-oxoacyl-ACP reductase-like protein
MLDSRSGSVSCCWVRDRWELPNGRAERVSWLLLLSSRQSSIARPASLHQADAPAPVLSPSPWIGLRSKLLVSD